MLNKIRKAVKLKRSRYDISLRKAAEYIGITASALCRFEQGKEPSVETFLKIAKWVGFVIKPQKPAAIATENREDMETAHVESTPSLQAPSLMEIADQIIWKVQGVNKESETYEQQLRDVRAEIMKLIDEY